MRIPLCVLLALPLAACVPAKTVRRLPPSPVVHVDASSPQAPVPTKIIPATPAPTAPFNPPGIVSGNVAGVTLEGISFDSRSHRLVVVDQKDGPGSRHADSAAAGRSLGGIAAVNAGFFTPEGAPLGLVMSAGSRSGSWNSASSLGNSVWYGNGSSMAIARRDSIGRATASNMRELIQAGPLLVENGNAVGGLEAGKTSARIVVLWDGGTRWWIGRGSPCTLAGFAQALSKFQPAGWKVKQALNLDGGRSADLWISGTVPDGPLVRRSPFNRPVRNFLVLVQK